MQPRYKRVLLKLSGEALAGDGKTNISPDVLNYMSAEIKPLLAHGV